MVYPQAICALVAAVLSLATGQDMRPTAADKARNDAIELGLDDGKPWFFDELSIAWLKGGTVKLTRGADIKYVLFERDYIPDKLLTLVGKQILVTILAKPSPPGHGELTWLKMSPTARQPYKSVSFDIYTSESKGQPVFAAPSPPTLRGARMVFEVKGAPGGKKVVPMKAGLVVSLQAIGK